MEAHVNRSIIWQLHRLWSTSDCKAYAVFLTLDYDCFGFNNPY